MTTLYTILYIILGVGCLFALLGIFSITVDFIVLNGCSNKFWSFANKFEHFMYRLLYLEK